MTAEKKVKLRTPDTITWLLRKTPSVCDVKSCRELENIYGSTFFMALTPAADFRLPRWLCLKYIWIIYDKMIKFKLIKTRYYNQQLITNAT